MVYFTNYMPDFGWVIILTTIIIKLILYPLFSAQIKNQIATQKAQPEIKDIQKQLKNKTLDPLQKQKLMMEMMTVNKKYGVKIFAPIINMVLTITILIALYHIIYAAGLPKINSELLYSFNKGLELNWTFLNIFDLSKPYLIFGILAGLTQYFYMTISMPDVKFSDRKKVGTEKGMEDMMKNFQVYIKYGLPVMIFFMGSFTFQAGLTIYWITSNIFMTVQEFLVRSKKEELKQIKNQS